MPVLFGGPITTSPPDPLIFFGDMDHPNVCTHVYRGCLWPPPTRFSKQRNRIRPSLPSAVSYGQVAHSHSRTTRLIRVCTKWGFMLEIKIQCICMELAFRHGHLLVGRSTGYGSSTDGKVRSAMMGLGDVLLGYRFFGSEPVRAFQNLCN